MRTLRAIAIGALITAAACSGKDKKAAADANLERDLALANAQTQQAQPSFQDTTVAPAPQPAARAVEKPPTPVRAPRASEKPTPKPPPPQPAQQAPQQQPAPTAVAQAPASATGSAPAAAPGPVHAEIDAGTPIALTSGSKVCSSSNMPGDKIVATLNADVTGTNGAVLPAGSSVVLEVASVKPGMSENDSEIFFSVRSIVVGDKTYNVSAQVTPLGQMQRAKVANADANADKKKVIGGAIVGGILGQVIGHSAKGTIIGAAGGAAAGAAAAKMSEKYEGCYPSGSPFKITLSQPLQMS